LNQNRARIFCFDAFSSREPVSTSLENALISEVSKKSSGIAGALRGLFSRKGSVPAEALSGSHHIDTSAFARFDSQSTVTRAVPGSPPAETSLNTFADYALNTDETRSLLAGDAPQPFMSWRSVPATGFPFQGLTY
jgi:hypothetical protein